MNKLDAKSRAEALLAWSLQKARLGKFELTRYRHRGRLTFAQSASGFAAIKTGK
jgi:hypothetical protein